MTKQNPYLAFLDDIEKPARYTGGELYSVVKDHKKCAAKAVLCYPDLYEIGMSHLGIKILYEETNRQTDLVAERCFAPWIDVEAELRKRKIPLVSLETFTPLSEFDLVGFSLQYEMTYTNILTMLDLGNIPIKSADRTDKDPIITAGGPCASEPEPLAPFIDIFTIGDGEDLFPKILREIGEMRAKGMARQEIIKSFVNYPGVYIPALYDTKLCPISKLEYVVPKNNSNAPSLIVKNIIPNLNRYNFPTKAPIPHSNTIFDRFSVEISRGCTEGCRFCQAGMSYRPLRERHPKEIIRTVTEGLKYGGFDEASLTCLSTADYSAVTPLIIKLLDLIASRNGKLGISSLRAYGLDKRILDKMAKIKNSSLTFAPEAGSERMRRVINKNITEADILKTAENIFSRGWNKMKLYFMIGLPTENDDDVRAIAELGSKVKNVARECRKAGTMKGSAEVTVSVSSFVPKPHTPFQWAAANSLSEIERKQELLFNLTRTHKLGFRHHFSKISFLEVIFARGDRRVATLLEKAWQLGARFDGSQSTINLAIWENAFSETNLPKEIFLSEIPREGHLPWEHINLGVTKEFLKNEWQKAMRAENTLPCGKVKGEQIHHNNLTDFDADKRPLLCHACGLKCNLKQIKQTRREFLESLDADTPDSLEAETQTPSRPPLRSETQGYFYRISYAKYGALSFISHLDLQKVLTRVFLRASIPIVFSAGFTKRPIILMGPALPLGISSLAEFVDIQVPERWKNIANELAKLQAASEPGLKFNSAIEITKQTKPIQLAMQEFSFFIPTDNNHNELAEALEKLNLASEVLVPRKRGDVSMRDVKHLIKDVKISEFKHPLAEEIDQISPCLNKSGFTIKGGIENGASIKPHELIFCLQAFGLKPLKPIKLEAVLG